MNDTTLVPLRNDFLGYRPEELVGQGGMGVVYRARDLRLNRVVALKLMAPELATDQRFRERFAREAELAMSLEHPNVVPIHDAGELDGHLYLVMRFVEGTDLRTLLREQGALAPRRALAIVAQVAHALDAAHARGLVHRDVKPSNVLLDADEHAYLADFGLTRPFGGGAEPSTEGRSLGTPAYLAPEQIEGRELDGRADVYSLGCLLYECLTGTPPFDGASRLAVAWAHLEEEPPRASIHRTDLPESIDPVVAKAMAKEPSDRYATCAELFAAAEGALGLEPRRRRRTVLLAVLAAVLAVAAAAAVVASRDTSEASGSSAPPDPEKLVRVDPVTNRVAAEIDVGAAPTAVAVGRSVWVYNRGDDTVSEIDAATNDVLHATEVSTIPETLQFGTGPILAADGGGAWLVGYDVMRDRHLLTHVLSGGRGAREHRLAMDPVAVVADNGSVWVLAHRGRRNAALRIDSDSGRVVERLGLPDDVGTSITVAGRAGTSTRVDGLAAGEGYLWATNLDLGRLYRIDTRSGEHRERDLGSYAARPVAAFGALWMCIAKTNNPAMYRVDRRTLREKYLGRALPAEEGQYAVGYGSVWRYDVPSGTLMRFDPHAGELDALVRVLPANGANGPSIYVTSIAAGAGGVWLTLSQS